MFLTHGETSNIPRCSSQIVTLKAKTADVDATMHLGSGHVQVVVALDWCFQKKKILQVVFFRLFKMVNSMISNDSMEATSGDAIQILFSETGFGLSKAISQVFNTFPRPASALWKPRVRTPFTYQSARLPSALSTTPNIFPVGDYQSESQLHHLSC